MRSTKPLEQAPSIRAGSADAADLGAAHTGSGHHKVVHRIGAEGDHRLEQRSPLVKNEENLVEIGGKKV